MRRLSDVLTLDRWCRGGCGLSAYRHRFGVIDPFGTLHFGDRRFTKRAAKNLLTAAARRERWADPGWLNTAEFTWLHLYHDAVAAQALAREAGFRLPSRLFDHERQIVRAIAVRDEIALSKYERVRSWLRG